MAKLGSVVNGKAVEKYGPYNLFASGNPNFTMWDISQNGQQAHLLNKRFTNYVWGPYTISIAPHYDSYLETELYFFDILTHIFSDFDIRRIKRAIIYSTHGKDQEFQEVLFEINDPQPNAENYLDFQFGKTYLNVINYHYEMCKRHLDKYQTKLYLRIYLDELPCDNFYKMHFFGAQLDTEEKRRFANIDLGLQLCDNIKPKYTMSNIIAELDLTNQVAQFDLLRLDVNAINGFQLDNRDQIESIKITTKRYLHDDTFTLFELNDDFATLLEQNSGSFNTGIIKLTHPTFLTIKTKKPLKRFSITFNTLKLNEMEKMDPDFLYFNNHFESYPLDKETITIPLDKFHLCSSIHWFYRNKLTGEKVDAATHVSLDAGDYLVDEKASFFKMVTTKAALIEKERDQNHYTICFQPKFSLTQNIGGEINFNQCAKAGTPPTFVHQIKDSFVEKNYELCVMYRLPEYYTEDGVNFYVN